MAGKKFSVELTLNDLVAIRDIIAKEYRDQRYAAERNPKEDQTPEEFADSWEGRGKVQAIAQRDRLNALHYALAGDYIEES
jgi:hypothetical protein